MGLSASGLEKSLMYPKQDPEDAKSYNVFYLVDSLWMKSIYGTDTHQFSNGQIEGAVIDGITGQPWEGAQIWAVPEEKIESFASGAGSNNIRMAALSKRDGKFEFPNLPPGNYYLMAHSLHLVGLNVTQFDEELKAFGRSDFMGGNFYDGKDREANLEPSSGYSPLLYYAAARVVVEPGQTTTGVEIISQDYSASEATIVAQGSSNEILSDYTYEDVLALIQSEFQKDQSPGSNPTRAGCAVTRSADSSVSGALIVLLGILGLAFAALGTPVQLIQLANT